MKFILRSSIKYFISVIFVYCYDVDVANSHQLKPVPPADPIKVGTMLTYKCPLNHQGTYQWHHTLQDRITTVSTPNLETAQYEFHLTLEDFDNNTSASCSVSGPQSFIPSGEGGIHVFGENPILVCYQVIYYNNDEPINYECNEYVQFIHTKYIMLLKANDVKILNNIRDITKANNGTMVACFYFKKIPNENKVVREVTNKKILIYKEPERTTTTTTLRTTSTSAIATTTTVSTLTILSTDLTYEQSPETTEYILKDKKAKTAEVYNHNAETVIVIACVMSALALLLVAATVSYIMYQKCKKPNENRNTVRMVTPIVQERPLPTPPELPINRYSYIFPSHEYSQIEYEEPQVQCNRSMGFVNR